jgi:hypothetical protein
MTALGGQELRKCWIANAERLDRLGHFAKYSPKQRAEVLRKGFLSPWAPDQGIRIARKELELGYAVRTPNYIDDLRDFGVVGSEEVRKTTLSLLDEVPPESYEPPCELAEPPGCPFIFQCKALGCEVYFKFQISGTPKSMQVLFWSYHPPKFRKK